LCRFRVESVNVFVLPRFHLSTFSSSKNNLTNSHMRKRFPEWVHCQVVWILRGLTLKFTGYKKIKQRRISFVLRYLRMILWKISTAISIKHRIWATFNKSKKKSILTACMTLNRYVKYQPLGGILILMFVHFNVNLPKHQSCIYLIMDVYKYIPR
jgi:hypothetical protein